MAEQRVTTGRALTIQPQPLTAERFAPYGKIVDQCELPLTSAHFPFFAQILPLQPATREVRWINRHLDHTQLFATFGGEPMLLIVAPPELAADAFDPAAIAAFVTDGQTAVVLHVGTWHTAPRALGKEPVPALNVQAENFHTHTELIDIAATTGCAVELVLAS